MEIWIRSQNKHILKKCNEITTFIETHNDIFKINGSKYYIISEDETILGEYKNEKRLLEVLDEIQKLITPKIITTQYKCEIKDNKKTEFDLIMNPLKTEIQELSTIVYQMPLE